LVKNGPKSPKYCRNGPRLFPRTQFHRPLDGRDGRRERRCAGAAAEPFSCGGWNDSKFGVGDVTGRGSIEFWTKSKKMTTKWNKEAGVNWMS